MDIYVFCFFVFDQFENCICVYVCFFFIKRVWSVYRVFVLDLLV